MTNHMRYASRIGLAVAAGVWAGIGHTGVAVTLATLAIVLGLAEVYEALVDLRRALEKK